MLFPCMSSQGGEGDHCQALPMKCKGVPTMMYQEKNRLKPDGRKPADKLRKSVLTRAKEKSLSRVVNVDVCNNDIDSKCPTNPARPRRRKRSNVCSQ